ncbi:receptor-like protein kinase 5 [Magnolia sinica]|uniref:receptor-like protein kinase 5 n=1 Tax=Magnolia sinica TaxID=86752 RepID=UPI00265ADCDC|nr:receptor-like protein kinase 5 [Magnolia sinica]
MDLLHRAFSFLLFSYLLFSSSFVFASANNSKALSTHKQCIEDHFSALLHLKHSFNFSAEFSKTRLPSWNPDNRDCCSWEGITCDGATGHVTSLNLNELDIFGRIDFVSLFRLQSLQKLNLASNYFNDSTIPSGFEQLTSLTHLNLSRSNFYGQIPLEISRLTTLVSLDLSFNEYSNGSVAEYLKLEIPNIGAFVQNLSSMRELHLDWVNISAQGSDWAMALSSALPLLRKLSLRGCYLSGPIHPSLSNLHFLSELHLSQNSLSSVVPNFIGNFSSLTSLRLRSCGLHGKFPESIFRLPNLQTLFVGYNPLLTGEIPPNNTLRELSLSDTGFCSNLRDSFTNSKLLTMIELSDCQLTGQFPSWLVKLEKLMHLDLSYNGFSGPLPSWPVKLEKLMHLDLSNNGFSGLLPSSIANLSNLAHLDLSANGFSGPLPSLLVKLDKLVSLDLSSNNFSGPIPSSYGNKFQNLQVKQEFYNNSLQWNHSIILFQNTSSSQLQTIDLSNNSLQEPIPRSIFALTKLHDLWLSSNNFSGDVDLGKDGALEAKKSSMTEDEWNTPDKKPLFGTEVGEGSPVNRTIMQLNQRIWVDVNGR